KNIYDLKDQYGISILYITHDLATAYHVSDYVMVLYHGHVVEAGPPKAVIGDPQHPYTQLLIDSIPWPDLERSWGTVQSEEADAARLEEIARRQESVMRGDIPGFELNLGDRTIVHTE
ncbi:MAG: ABC transporter ATP-binding protein, partial [Pseudomonadota bacterium]